MKAPHRNATYVPRESTQRTRSGGLHQDLQTVLRCHLAAFAALGGVPRQILYDRMKTAVTGEDAEGHIVYNRTLVATLNLVHSIPFPKLQFEASVKHEDPNHAALVEVIRQKWERHEIYTGKMIFRYDMIEVYLAYDVKIPLREAASASRRVAAVGCDLGLTLKLCLWEF